jgi:hypothetical protein
MKYLWLKTYINKTNNQISVSLPKKKIKQFLDEDKIPKMIKMRIEDLKW